MPEDVPTSPIAEAPVSPVRGGQAPPALGRFFGAWFVLSMQSFGGGPATLTLIRRAMVEQNSWVPEAEFNRFWALVQVAPGINLLALTVLIGRRVAGVAGILTALLGLLLPSVTLTVLITAYYARVQRSPVVQAAVRGVLPATVGLGLLTAINMGRSLLSESAGRGGLLLGIALLVGSGLAFAAGRWPVVLILLAGGAIAAAVAAAQNARRKTNGFQKPNDEETPPA